MGDNIEHIRERLETIRAACDEAVRRRDGAEYSAAHDQMLLVERELASLEMQEYAEPIKEAAWRPAYPEPLIWHDGHTAWLICPQPSSRRPLLCKAIKFGHVLGLRVSVVSDTLEEQPLNGKGLESCMALQVKNSRWISNLRATYDEDQYWSDVRHFAMCFEDSLVEVVAKSVEWIDSENTLAVWVENATGVAVNSPTFNAI
ncbi:MAG: hypothetical protein SFY80_12990 [Verrucomicrobiota bacterium]|nr:hypothetical protein [Verrucomicrobiota bacterium]